MVDHLSNESGYDESKFDITFQQLFLSPLLLHCGGCLICQSITMYILGFYSFYVIVYLRFNVNKNYF